MTNKRFGKQRLGLAGKQGVKKIDEKNFQPLCRLLLAVLRRSAASSRKNLLPDDSSPLASALLAVLLQHWPLQSSQEALISRRLNNRMGVMLQFWHFSCSKRTAVAVDFGKSCLVVCPQFWITFGFSKIVLSICTKPKTGLKSEKNANMNCPSVRRLQSHRCFSVAQLLGRVWLQTGENKNTPIKVLL